MAVFSLLIGVFQSPHRNCDSGTSGGYVQEESRRPGLGLLSQESGSAGSRWSRQAPWYGFWSQVRKELQNLYIVFFDAFVTSSVCLCLCCQSEHHLGPSAQTETDRPVFSHPDAGSGEAGESRTQESSPHHRQGEGCGCLCRPENALQTLQLLHCESAGRAPSVWLRFKRRKETTAVPRSVRSVGQRRNSTTWWRFWGSTSTRRTWSSSGAWNVTDASGNESHANPRSNVLPSPPQHVRMRGIFRPRAGDADKEGERLLHPRQDERQTQQDFRRLPGPEKVTRRPHSLSDELKSALTCTISVSQRNPGVHGCDGQRHRHTWCELGAAVRPSQQRQVSPQIYEGSLTPSDITSFSLSPSQRLRSSVWAYGTHRQSGQRSRLPAPHGGVLRQLFVHQPESEYFVGHIWVCSSEGIIKRRCC